MTALNVSNAIENATALSLYCNCLIIQASDPLGHLAKAFIGEGALAAPIVAIVSIIQRHWALISTPQPSMDEFLDHGIVTLGKIIEGPAIYQVCQNVAKTAASAHTIAPSLSMFMVNLMPFVMAGKQMIGSDTSLMAL